MLEFKLIYGIDGYEKARHVRETVFMSEQGFSFDKDDKDEISWHVIAYDKDRPIAAARLYPKADGVFAIGRVAVVKDCRGQYIGDTLMRILEDKAVNLMGHTVDIHANDIAAGFYEKQGYERTGECDSVDGVGHCMMRKDLTKPFKRCDACKNGL